MYQRDVLAREMTNGKPREEHGAKLLERRRKLIAELDCKPASPAPQAPPDSRVTSLAYLEGYYAGRGQADGYGEGNGRKRREIPAGSQSDLVMQAAKSMPPGPFDRADLVVAAWKLAPNVFGLDGQWRLHPCSNKVYALLAGKRGLVGRGLLRKVAAKRYEVVA